MAVLDFVTRGLWASFCWGIGMALAVAVAVFGFGAPGWILVPVAWAGITAHALLTFYVDRRTGRRTF